MLCNSALAVRMMSVNGFTPVDPCDLLFLFLISGSTRLVSDEGEDHIDHPAVTGQREMDAGNALDQFILPDISRGRQLRCTGFDHGHPVFPDYTVRTGTGEFREQVSRMISPRSSGNA